MNSAPDKINLADVTDNSPVSVQLGYGLIEMVDEDTGGPRSIVLPAFVSKVSRPWFCCTACASA